MVILMGAYGRPLTLTLYMVLSSECLLTMTLPCLVVHGGTLKQCGLLVLQLLPIGSAFVPLLLVCTPHGTHA